MIIALKIAALAFMVTWASCTVGCTDVSTTSTGGSSEQTLDTGQEKVELPAEEETEQPE